MARMDSSEDKIARVFYMTFKNLQPILIENVNKSLQYWADGILQIGEDFRNQNDYKQSGISFVKKLYAFEKANVLFKPTLAKEQPFRQSVEGAHSYFVGDNTNYPEDLGFAIKHWINISFKLGQYVVNDNLMTWMGYTNFFNDDNEKVTVHSTFLWGHFHQESHPQIIIHHSSLSL